jgi:hypothetical protein
MEISGSKMANFNFDFNETSSYDGSLQLESLGHCENRPRVASHMASNILQAKYDSTSSGTLSPSEGIPKFGGKQCKIFPSPINDHLGKLEAMDHQPSSFVHQVSVEQGPNHQASSLSEIEQTTWQGL